MERAWNHRRVFLHAFECFESIIEVFVVLEIVQIVLLGGSHCLRERANVVLGATVVCQNTLVVHLVLDGCCINLQVFQLGHIGSCSNECNLRLLILGFQLMGYQLLLRFESALDHVRGGPLLIKYEVV